MTAAAVVSATVLVPNNNPEAPSECTGLNSDHLANPVFRATSCPGSIEIVPPNLGTFYAADTGTIYGAIPGGTGFANPVRLGTLSSAVFRKDAGIPQYTFYYQLQLTADALPIAELGFGQFSGPSTTYSTQFGYRAWSFLNVGVTTASIGSYGSTSFVASSLLPSDIVLVNGITNNLYIDYSSPPVIPGVSTATIVIQTDAPYYARTSYADMSSVPVHSPYGISILGFLVDNHVLVPATAPEPSTGTTFLVGLAGGIGFLGLRGKRRVPPIGDDGAKQC